MWAFKQAFETKPLSSKFNPNRFLSVKFLLLVLLVLFSGCASISVYDSGSFQADSPSARPEKIFVREFATPDNAFRVDRDGRDLREFQASKRGRLASAIVKRLEERVAPAEILPLNAPAPQGNFWLLDGRFDEVKQGSRLLRAGVGFGVGATKVATTAFLSRLDEPKPVRMMVIRTTGGSGAEPGAVAGFNPLTMAFVPIGMAFNAAGGARGGLSADTTRTAREIVATINEFSHSHNLIPDKKRLRPKRLGQIPAHLTPWQESD
jgi:hypothetical protein